MTTPTEKIIPDPVKLAAKRAFARTTLQSYAATLGGGISAVVILSVIRGEIDPVETIVTAAVALTAPLLAGLVAWMDYSAKGIPADYLPAAIEQAPPELLRRDLR